MKPWEKKRQPLTGMLIFLLLATVFALPPGVHLEICFGFDGRIDTTPDACIIGSTGQPQKHVRDVNRHDHHENCLDVVIGCISLDTLVHTKGKDGLCKSKIKRDDSSTSAGNAIDTFSRLPNKFSAHIASLHNIDIPSLSISSLKTVLLLI